jgi:hypothetical protein
MRRTRFLLRIGLSGGWAIHPRSLIVDRETS